MMAGEVGTKPSLRFLGTGVPTRLDRRAIEALSRRREYLGGLLVTPDYDGAGDDRREAAALDWALALIAAVRREGGGLDGSHAMPRTDRDD